MPYFGKAMDGGQFSMSQGAFNTGPVGDTWNTPIKVQGPTSEAEKAVCTHGDSFNH